MIFLTGMPRCGSTWAGMTLAHLTRSRYVHEPVNGHRHPEWAAYSMRYFRRSACDRTLIRALKESVRPLEPRPWWRQLWHGSDPVVLKEVHATLAIECVDRHLKPDVVIMTRHPCGVAASWKSLGWLAEHLGPGDPLLAQEHLVEDHLAPFESHILSSTEPFFRLGAYWGAIYYVLRRLAAGHPGWQYITHEELCSAPRERMTQLLHDLRLPVDPAAFDFLAEHDRPRSADEGPYTIFRKTGLEADKWKRLLTPEEISSVMAGAEPFDVVALLGSPGGVSGPRIG
jgi:hypothetical protein